MCGDGILLEEQLRPYRASRSRFGDQLKLTRIGHPSELAPVSFRVDGGCTGFGKAARFADIFGAVEALTIMSLLKALVIAASLVFLNALKIA